MFGFLSPILSLFTGGDMWKYIAIGLGAIVLVLSLTTYFEMNHIESLNKKITEQTLVMAQMKIAMDKKDNDIANLQDLVSKNAVIYAQSQDRIKKLMNITSHFGPSIVVKPDAPREIQVINKNDSDKIINWLNTEAWK